MVETKQIEAVDVEIAQLTKVLETSENVEEIKRARTQLDELIVEKRRLSRLRGEEIKREEAAEMPRLKREAKNVEREIIKELENLLSISDQLEACMKRLDDAFGIHAETLRSKNMRVASPINPDHVSLWAIRRFLKGDLVDLRRALLREKGKASPQNQRG